MADRNRHYHPEDHCSDKVEVDGVCPEVEASGGLSVADIVHTGDIDACIASLENQEDGDEIDAIVRRRIQSESGDFDDIDGELDIVDDCLFADCVSVQTWESGLGETRFHDLETDSLYDEDFPGLTTTRNNTKEVAMGDERPQGAVGGLLGNSRALSDDEKERAEELKDMKNRAKLTSCGASRDEDAGDEVVDRWNRGAVHVATGDMRAVNGAEGGADSDDEERANEIAGLQKRGILPSDFPSCQGNLDKYDDEDIAKEITELLSQGAISMDEADQLRDRHRQQRPVNEDVTEANVCPLAFFDREGLPPNWTKRHRRSVAFRLVELLPGEEEFETIKEEFARENIEVRKVERLQNGRLLERFKAELDDLRMHRSNAFDMNVQYLYHGTSVDKLRICEEGLDQRLSRMGFFGKGIYFSDNPIKCIHYADGSSNPEEACILKCRVILGDSKVYAPGCYDTTLKREPEKESKTDGWRYYDSVVGCPRDHNEYVVYENRRAMIEYFISFHLDKSVLKPKQQQQQQQQQTASQMSTANQTSNNSGATWMYIGGNSSQSDPLTDEDHFQRISEVREAVRKKRMEEKGQAYIPPSQTQVNKDREMWLRLQRLHGHLAEVYGPKKQSSLTTTSPPAVSTPASLVTVSSSNSTSNNNNNNNSTNNNNVSSVARQPVAPWDEPSPVQQVLDACVAEFLLITDTTDTDVARFYVQKGEMDINTAISMYFEDL